MSSYIIAGSADSIDTAYCQEIARRINSKYKNIDFRIVIKHPTQWEKYLQEICRIYGFLKKSNPIIYTFDGKIIGNKENFIQTANKYFGLDQESLLYDNVSSVVNMKLANEQIRQKKIVKDNKKTLVQKIEFKYKELLANKILKHNLKQIDTYLVNGIEYIYRELNSVPKMNFIKNKQIPLKIEEIVPEEINLMALSLNDQIKPQEGVVGKEAFVTHNNQKEKHPPSEQDKVSQHSRTNKLHESNVSYDKDSKGVKESNQTKLKIDEQNDDVPDYIDYALKQTVVCELADDFFITFDAKSLMGQELIFYCNEDQNGNMIRIYNDGRPIKGHRILIKEVHYDNQNLIQHGIFSKQQISEMDKNQEIKEYKEQPIVIDQNTLIEKSKTEPNIPAIQSQKILNQIPTSKEHQDAVSEPHSQLNLISHLSYHTLFIHKPLSNLQLKNVSYFIKETNTIGCLQFLPENPNPSLKLYVRSFLLHEQVIKDLPVQRFIRKQIQDGQYSTISVPSQKGTLIITSEESDEVFQLRIINDLGFNHYIYELKNDNEERLAKVIKYTIDHLLYLEEQLKMEIGYNLIFTDKFIMVVPLVFPYDVYNQNKLYFDGLAYLGYIHAAHLQKSYQISRPKIGTESKGEELRQLLAKSTGITQQ